MPMEDIESGAKHEGCGRLRRERAYKCEFGSTPYYVLLPRIGTGCRVQQTPCTILTPTPTEGVLSLCTPPSPQAPGKRTYCPARASSPAEAAS